MEMTQVKLSSGRALRFRRDETAPAPDEMDGVSIDCFKLGLYFSEPDLPDGQPWGHLPEYYEFPLVLSERSECLSLAPEGVDLRRYKTDGRVYLLKDRASSEEYARWHLKHALEKFSLWYWDRVIRIFIVEADGEESEEEGGFYAPDDFFYGGFSESFTPAERDEIRARRREIEAAFLLAGGRLH